MGDYHVNVFWSDEDNCYVADIPDLRYCSAFGGTPERWDDIEKAASFKPGVSSAVRTAVS